ncbi:MAG: NAD(P) transhydrogenase subunit alpha [Verrucomicrobiota bacterium]
MQIFVPKESDEKERRAALVPASVKRLVDLGCEVVVEAGLGVKADYPDAAYEEAGASVSSDRGGSLKSADMVMRVDASDADEIGAMKEGALHISFLNVFERGDLLSAFAKGKVNAVSLEMMPRSTLAQKMDALSSQANLAGYSAVVVAAERMNKILPMMMTPAGTISPANYFVLGIGVAGLQAIATAKRLGARVTAFDVRPEALEQAESLGAKALRIDLGETGGTAQGYAKELTPEQLETQRQEQGKVCAQSDVVITTAKLFGRKSPILIKEDVVKGMKAGSIIVDLAAESGGNVEGTVLDEEVVTDNGVRIIGIGRLEGLVSADASAMYSANLHNFVDHFWDKEAKELKLDAEDELLKGCLVVRDGEINESWKKR